MPFKGSGAASALNFCLLAMVMSNTTSCVAPPPVIARKGGQPTQTLLTTNREDLISQLLRHYNEVQTLNATVDMVPALGTANKGKITEYKDVRAYILFRKPSGIRIVGLYPVVRNKAFDMVSDGASFSLYLPPKNRFIQGSNEVQNTSPNKLENLRPQVFLDSLLVRPIDPSREQTVLENFTDEDNAVYILSSIAPGADGQPVILR